MGCKVTGSGIGPAPCAEGDCPVCSAEDRTDPGKTHCFARISYAVADQVIEVGAEGSVHIPQGIVVSGQLNLMGWRISLVYMLTKTSFYCDAQMDPIDISGIIQVGRSLDDMSTGHASVVIVTDLPAGVQGRDTTRITRLSLSLQLR